MYSAHFHLELVGLLYFYFRDFPIIAPGNQVGAGLDQGHAQPGTGMGLNLDDWTSDVAHRAHP